MFRKKLLHRIILPACLALAGHGFGDGRHATLDKLAAEAATFEPAFVKPAAAPFDATKGTWTAPIPWPHIPVTAATLPNGKVLTYAADSPNNFTSNNYSYAAVWDPATGNFTEVDNTRHDGLCGATVMLPDGRFFVAGGQPIVPLCSIFDYRTNQWTAAPNLNDSRWYNSSVGLPDGNIFTVSGWGGETTGERWDPTSGWRRLPNLNWASVRNQPGYLPELNPLITLAPNGKIFHFGPTHIMNWVDPNGAGSTTPSGQTVPGTQYAKESAWVTYDQGKVLVAGGGASSADPNGTGAGVATNNTYTIDLNGATPVVQAGTPMQFARTFCNPAVLPTGEVIVIGGNTSATKFSDVGSIMTPEIWNPTTGLWRAAADMPVPRNYHSTVLLLPDGRVWSGGGGLSGNSSTDHLDAQIYTPSVLLNSDGSLATRPVLTTAPAQIGLGAVFNVTGTAGLARMSFIRMSSTTHSMNYDLRSLSLPFTENTAGNYTLTANSNSNVMTPGYWMLFGVAPSGTYSVAKIILVTTDGGPVIASPGDQFTSQGASVSLQIQASVPAGGISNFSAVGLPDGLSISASGLITGTAATAGTYSSAVTVMAPSGSTSSATFNWTILSPLPTKGSIYGEYWLNIPGNQVSDLTSNAAYPCTPANNETFPTFEAGNNVTDNFGRRLRGFVYPATTGQYQFWIAADETAQLFLSTSSSPLNAPLVAQAPAATNPRQYTKYTQQASGPINLVAGQAYYIEALMKEGTGNDNLSVAWQPPGTSAPVVIPGASMAPYLPYLNPVAAWSFDEGAWAGVAGEIKDSAKLLPNLSGTAVGGVTTTSGSPALAGNPGTGRSAHFNGTNQYAVFPAKAAVQTTDFTVAAWVKADAATSGAWRGIVGSRETVSGGALHGFNLDASPDGKWTIITGGTWTGLYGPAVVAGQWTHLAATFHATSISAGTATGVRTLYVNGVQAAQDTATYTPVASSTAQVYAGATDANGSGQSIIEFFAGNIDEVRIYPGAMSASDVQLAMNLRHLTNQPPSVAPLANQNSVIGSNIALQVSATDADNDPLSYSAIGLPPGLTMSASGGVISGSPTTAGSYTPTVSVSDGTNITNISFAWSVQLALTLQPLSNAIVASGSSVALTVTSIGGVGAQYSWNFGDGSAATAFSSSTSASHTYAAPGRYLVTVTGQDSTGRVVTTSFYQGVSAPLTAKKPTSSSNIAYETRASGNAHLWVANPDADTVSVFDAVTRTKLAETTVAASPRSVAVAPDGRIWVVGAEGAAISILNSSTYSVVQTVLLPRGSRPYGLAFDPVSGAAWLTLEYGGRLLRLDSFTGAQTASIDTGLSVRHLSVSADGTKVYVSRFITPHLPGEETATIDTSTKGAEVLVINTGTLTVASTLVLHHSEKIDTSVSSHGIPNYLGAPVISPDGLSAWVPSKQDNIKRGQLRNGLQLDHESTVRAIASRLDLVAQAETLNSRVDFDNGGVPSALCYDPNGIYAFVALEANRAVAVVDVWNAVEITRFPAGRAPQGVTLSPDGKTLFVENFMDRTVTVHDVSAILNGTTPPVPILATMSSVAVEKFPANVLLGKQLFYDAQDPRLALEGYISCASCHNDGDGDGRTWDFTGMGEGLRNTIAIKGHAGTTEGPLHWSGNFDEVQDFENQIRTLAGGTGLITNGTPNPPLGAPNAGRSSDLDALAAYLASLTVTGASPARTDAVSFSPSAIAGRAVFQAQNCASCHSGNYVTNSALNVFANIGTLNAAAGQRLGATLTGFDVPTLRGLWSSGPYLHDGSAPTIAAAIQAHQGVSLNSTDLANLAAYLNGLDDDAAPPAQFADASFEAPKLSTGYLYNPLGSVWTFSANSGVAANASGFTSLNPNAPQGNQVAFLQFNGSISQTLFNLTPGASYTITFSAAQRASSRQTWNLTLDGQAFASFSPPAAANAYTDYSASFTATAATHTLAFVATNLNGGDNTIFLDNLRLAPGPLTFNAFEQPYFTSAQLADPTISGPTADANNDGVDNLLAAALSLSPWAPAAPNLPTMGTDVNGHLTFVYQRKKAPTAWTNTVEVSDDLVTWNSGPTYTTEIAISPLSADTEQVTVQDNALKADHPKRFFRLKVSQ